jgi:NADH:ubiquinone oxidoreductase subunit E
MTRVDRRLKPLGWDAAVDLDKPPASIPEPSEAEVPAELRERIEALMARYPDRRSAALPALDAAQRVLGRRYVYVCTSVACHVRNAKAVHDAIADQAGEQGLEDCDIREFECLGACDMAPMASVDGRYVGPLDASDAEEIVAALKEDREVLPGRGLTDPGYQLPWAQRGEQPPARPDGPPTPPDPSPA